MEGGAWVGQGVPLARRRIMSPYGEGQQQPQKWVDEHLNKGCFVMGREQHRVCDRPLGSCALECCRRPLHRKGGRVALVGWPILRPQELRHRHEGLAIATWTPAIPGWDDPQLCDHFRRFQRSDVSYVGSRPTSISQH